MGAFSKALKDAQYLMPLSQSLVNYKKQQDEMEGRKKLLELMDSMNQISQTEMKTRSAGLEPSTWEQNSPISKFTQQPIQGPQLSEIPFSPRTIPGDPNRPIAPNIPTDGNIQTEVLGDYKPEFNPQKKPGDYTKARDNIKGKFSQIIGKYALDPNVSPEQLNQVLQLTQMGIPSAPVQPKYDYKEVDGTLIRVDDTGNIVPVYQSKQGNKDVEVSTYVGSDNFQYTTMRKPDGKTYEIKSVNPVRDTRSNTNIKIDTGLKEEKWGEVADLIAQIKNPIVVDENGNTSTRSADEISKLKTKLYNTAVIKKLVPSAKAWYDKEIKGKWGRENISQDDFLAELEEGLSSGNLSAEAGQDLLEFYAYRPEIFDNLDTTSVKNKKK